MKLQQERICEELQSIEASDTTVVISMVPERERRTEYPQALVLEIGRRRRQRVQE